MLKIQIPEFNLKNAQFIQNIPPGFKCRHFFFAFLSDKIRILFLKFWFWVLGSKYDIPKAGFNQDPFTNDTGKSRGLTCSRIETVVHLKGHQRFRQISKKGLGSTSDCFSFPF